MQITCKSFYTTNADQDIRIMFHRVISYITSKCNNIFKMFTKIKVRHIKIK